MMPSMARTLSSLLSFSWPPRSSSFPLVITILVANVFIFLARLTEKSIRRQVGGAQGTQQSHSLARARGAGARGRREEGERGGRGFLPHSPRQQGPIGRCRLRLATGHQSWIELLMSPSAAGEVCAWLGYLQAILGGSSCPAPGLGGRSRPPLLPQRRVAHLVALRVVHTSWGVGGGGDVGVPAGEG